MQPQATQPYSPSSPPAAAGPRRGDAFDPSVSPNAPGAPRPLGTTAPSAPLAQSTDPEEPVGAPGGRSAGAPLDLSTLTGVAGNSEPSQSTSCRPRKPPRTNTTSPTAISCAGNMRWPTIRSGFSCAASRTIDSLPTRNTGSAKACSSASAIAMRRKCFSMSRPNSKPPPRVPIRSCGSGNRSRGLAKKTRRVRRSPRSGANIRAHRSA